MLNQLIYRAQDRVNNRFLLCSEVAKVARCLHLYSATTPEAITDALVRVGNASCLAPDEPRHGRRDAASIAARAF